MKKHFLITILLLVSAVVMAQDVSGKISQRDLRDLNRQIKRRYRKFKHYPPFDSMLIINLLDVEYEETVCLSKSYIASGKFLNHIKPSKIPLLKKIFKGVRMHDLSIVAKRNGKLPLIYGGYKLRLIDLDYPLIISKYIVQNEIVSVYNISPLKDYYYFAIDNNDHIHVLCLDYREMNACPIEDFPDEEWYKLFYPPWDRALKKEYEASEKEKVDKR